MVSSGCAHSIIRLKVAIKAASCLTQKNGFQSIDVLSHVFTALEASFIQFASKTILCMRLSINIHVLIMFSLQYIHPMESRVYQESIRVIRKIGRECILRRIAMLEKGEPVPNDILSHILSIARKCSRSIARRVTKFCLMSCSLSRLLCSCNVWPLSSMQSHAECQLITCEYKSLVSF